jgi:hypothetical protein
MAFNTKYTAAFTELVGPSRVLTDYAIYFKKDGYSGAVTELTFGGDALTAKIINNEDSFLGIKEKKISISFLSDLDLSELQLAKPNEWKVEIISTVNFTISTNFVGYLNPTTGQTDYVDGLRPIRLEAIDGLTNLKNIDFVDDSSVYYEGLTSVFDVIRLCLKKIGTDLNLNIINNTFGSGHSTADTAEALKQRYIDLDLFRGTKEPLDTYKVLSQICTTEKCRLYQEGGEWWIENVTEKIIDGQVKWRKYLLSDGSRTAYGTLDLRTSAVFDSLSYKPMAGGSTSANKPIKFAKVEHKLSDFKNQLLNRDLRTWSGTEFESWTRNGTGVTRVGEGTSGNPYGVKIAGFVSKSKDSKSIYQTIILGTSAGGTAASALQKNITFSGQAYTQDVETAVVRCYLQIVTFDYGTFLFGLNDAGEWVRNGAEIALKNSDVNNHSKKTAVNWNVTSKRVGDVSVFTSTGATIPWEANINRVEVVVHLLQAVGQLEPYAGETQSSNVWYKNINLGWVNADTNLNLKQLNYKANNDSYAPVDETYEAVYGDYADGGNLSALKNNDGSVTSLWISPTEAVARNFHAIGAADLLNVRRETQKVYDGEIWGNILYRHCLTMAGFTRKGYVVSWEYNYGTSFTTVRVVEHQANVGVEVKKTGLLSDGTEIDLVGETVPSPSVGHGTRGVLGRPTGITIDVADNWIKQVIGGIQGRNPDDAAVNVIWNSITAEDTFDFGSMVRQGEVLRIAKNETETETEIGNVDSITKILGQFSLKNTFDYLANFSVSDLTADRVITYPDRDIEVNNWNSFVNIPADLTAIDALSGNSGILRKTGVNTWELDTTTYLSSLAGITAGGELSGTYPAPTLLNSAVIAKVLTGLNISGGVISASDSILSAIGKLQNQVTGLAGGLIYQGTWNASTNTPTITSSTGTKGHYYVVNVAGTSTINGVSSWALGDWIIFNGTVWEKQVNSNLVNSVNGFVGVVNLTTANISEVTNLYFTNARARASVGLNSANNAVANFNTDLLQTNGTYTYKLPDSNIGGITVLNDWNYLLNKPTKRFFFQQNTAASTWVITHGLGEKCIVQTFDLDDNQIYGNVKNSATEIHVVFKTLETGYAICLI